MPTNLNALIRYKQIDACLKNLYVKCTIERLREVCSEAMGEHRGIYKLVSERTIRDDIRVMRSNILGFNAPIEFEDGKYIYTDKDYSIFKTPVTETKLLRDILKMLINERKGIADFEIDKLLKRISLIVGEPLPRKIEKDIANRAYIESEAPRVLYSIGPSKTESQFIDELVNENKSIIKRDSITIKQHRLMSIKQEDEPLLMWDEILKIL